MDYEGFRLELIKGGNSRKAIYLFPHNSLSHLSEGRDLYSQVIRNLEEAEIIKTPIGIIPRSRGHFSEEDIHTLNSENRIAIIGKIIYSYLDLPNSLERKMKPVQPRLLRFY